METKKYITLKGLSLTIGLPKTYLRKLAEKREIPCLDVGGRLKFNLEAVQRALSELAAKGGDDE